LIPEHIHQGANRQLLLWEPYKSFYVFMHACTPAPGNGPKKIIKDNNENG